MRIKKESFTIVITGHWNPYIVSPNWISENVLQEKEIMLEVPANLGLPHRITLKQANLRIIPSAKRVMFSALNYDDKTLEKMESVAHKLVNTLSYTPIDAFGINFGFTEEQKMGDLTKNFELLDNKLLTDIGCQISSTSIMRKLNIKDRILNLNISKLESSIDFDFNFHYDVKNASEAISKLQNIIIENKNIAEKILQNGFKLEYEKGDSNA